MVKKYAKETATKEQEKLTRAKLTYEEKRRNADAVISSKGEDFSTCRGLDLEDVLGAMKTKGDRLPTKKADMLALYIKWKGENRA